MVERGGGRVLNVASIAAFQPVPMLATNAAIKAYVLSRTESLAEEMRGTGVGVGVTVLARASPPRPAFQMADSPVRDLRIPSPGVHVARSRPRCARPIVDVRFQLAATHRLIEL
jgi:NAD(P)-dependent dehydrogenase (short-subunit alcohol dehydrogenase family)